MEDIDEIRRLRMACEDMELENRETLAKYTDEQLSDIYNGIGPEGFPGWLRKALDALHPSLRPVAMIHDVEWQESDGSRTTFDMSNARFRRNGADGSSPARRLRPFPASGQRLPCQRAGRRRRGASAGGGRAATR